ncbi:ATP-grasp domain-containing protein [Streptomyces termitum]|uniref:ATP-grasp domain-containing protein n=1 Tax=Streptomyces termitum TaxID=67368 RepID=UPI001672B0DB|nr:ATP-grasp domain-containing protein [Streptomyces termitum]
METILIVGGRPETLVKAKALGLRVVFLQHRDRMMDGHVEASDALFMVDYTDWEQTRPIVDAVHQVYKFTACVSLGEQAMETVGRINDRYGLGGTPEAVSTLYKDKLLMRAHLAERGVPSAAAAEVDSAAAIGEFGREHGYPVVLKPVDNTASRGVVVIERAEDVAAAWEDAVGLRHRDDLVLGQFFPVGRYIVEEYLDGPEYSVESFSFGGHHAIVAITEKYTIGVVEDSHALPARLSPEVDAEVAAYVRDFHTAMGLRDGVAHTEIKITSKGPRVIESHDRLGGERIVDLVIDAYGIDLEQYATAAPFGLLPVLPERPTARRGAATAFFRAVPGVVTGFSGTEAVLNDPDLLDLDVFVRPGDRVDEVVDNFGRSGQVLTTGPDTDTAFATAHRLASLITVETTPEHRP